MAVDVEKLVKYWNETSAEKWKVAEGLKSLGHLPESLFFCHLSIEAKLKALIVIQTKEHAPYSHLLPRLALLAGLEPNERQIEQLKELTKFNIEGRYKEYKEELHRSVTKEYFATCFMVAKDILTWLSL